VELIPLDEGFNVINPDNVYEISSLRIANESAIPIALVGAAQWDSFSTEIGMGQEELGNAWKQPQFGFPFDTVSDLMI
jgi:hypothetical protein